MSITLPLVGLLKTPNMNHLCKSVGCTCSGSQARVATLDGGRQIVTGTTKPFSKFRGKKRFIDEEPSLANTDTLKQQVKRIAFWKGQTDERDHMDSILGCDRYTTDGLVCARTKTLISFCRHGLSQSRAKLVSPHPPSVPSTDVPHEVQEEKSGHLLLNYLRWHIVAHSKMNKLSAIDPGIILYLLWSSSWRPWHMLAPRHSSRRVRPLAHTVVNVIDILTC